MVEESSWKYVMRFPTILVNKPLRKAADTGLVDMEWKRPRKSNQWSVDVGNRRDDTQP